MIDSRKKFRYWSLLCFLGILAALGWQFDVSTILANVHASKQNWGIISIGLIVLYLIRPFLLWPLSLFSIFIGYLVGFPLGVPIVLFCTVLTCLPPFLIMARFGRSFPYIDHVADHGSDFIGSTGELRGMIAARLSPAPADAVSYGAGLAGVSVQAFAVGTLVGELPWAIFYVLLGRSLQTLSSGTVQQTDIRLVLFAAAISVLLIIRPLYEYICELKDQRDSGSSNYSG